MFFFICSWINWDISQICIFLGASEAWCGKHCLWYECRFHSIAFSSPLNHRKNSNGRNFWLLAIWKSWIFLVENFQKSFFRCYLKNWNISLLLIFVEVSEVVCTDHCLHLEVMFHYVAFFVPLKHLKNPTDRNYWLLSIWKNWIFRWKISKVFFQVFFERLRYLDIMHICWSCRGNVRVVLVPSPG